MNKMSILIQKFHSQGVHTLIRESNDNFLLCGPAIIGYDGHSHGWHRFLVMLPAPCWVYGRFFWGATLGSLGRYIGPVPPEGCRNGTLTSEAA